MNKNTLNQFNQYEQLELPFDQVVNDYGEYAPQPTYIARINAQSELNNHIEDEDQEECA